VSGVYNPIARTLWTLAGSGLGTTLSGAGSANSGAIDITSVTDLWLAVYVAGTATGTTPTLDVQIDVQDPAGNWFAQVAKITQLTSGPNYSTVSCGLHIASTGSMVLPAACRVTWTLGGSGPVFPQASISLVGR
jgi:hypothetical protein